MLKQELRLKRSLFKGLKPLKTLSGSALTLRVFSLGSIKTSKFAVSVSKKQEKGAVGRNRIRRVSYRAIKENINEAKPGLAYHFILKEKPKDLKNDITSEILKLLRNS